MSEKRIAVIGAGPAGLTTAYLLAKSDIAVDVYEAAPQVGGLSRSFELWDQIVDVGPHRFFSGDKQINDLWMEVAGNDYCMVNRITRIYYNEKFFYYPLKPFDALLKMGPITALQCVLSYLVEKLKPKKASLDTFSEWVIDRFGKKLFTIFFKTYTEKLWGISCDELDSDFAAQRIKKFSLGEALLTALNLSRKKHKTLVDEFAYPLEGTGSIYEKMTAYVEKQGSRVLTKSPVQKIIVENGVCNGIVDQNGATQHYDHVVSTMPLTLLVKGISETPDFVRAAAEKLRFRNTIIVYLEVQNDNLFEDQWLYIHDSRVQFGRITNFRNWSKEITKNRSESILALEYWCFKEDDLWSASDEELISLAKSEVEKVGLNNGYPIPRGHVLKINRSYPVYETGYKDTLKVVQEYLGGIDNLTPIGRYGSFKYNNQDHSILMGILTAQNIVNGSNNDLWTVNTDYENYQESSEVEKTGLS